MALKQRSDRTGLVSVPVIFLLLQEIFIEIFRNCEVDSIITSSGSVQIKLRLPVLQQLLDIVIERQSEKRDEHSETAES